MHYDENVGHDFFPPSAPLLLGSVCWPGETSRYREARVDIDASLPL